MAVAFTQLAAMSASTSQANSYAGTAGTPASGDLLICFVSASDTTAVGTMTGGGFTWRKLTSFTKNGGLDTLYVFWTIATSATSTTPTFDCTGDNATGCLIYCLRVTGDQAKPRPYFRQIRTATESSANPAVTMAQAILTDSGVCGFVVNGTNSAAQFTAPGSWTENAENAYNTPPNGGEVASRASGETGSTITWTNSNTTAWGAIVIEIAVDDSVPQLLNEENTLRKKVPFLSTKSEPYELRSVGIYTEISPEIRRRVSIHADKLSKRGGKKADEEFPNLLTSTLSATPTVNVPRFHKFEAKLKPRTTLRNEEFPNLLMSTLEETGVPFVQQELEQGFRKKGPVPPPEIVNLLMSTLGTQYVFRQGVIQPLGKARAAKKNEEVPNLLTSTLGAEPPETVNVPRIHQVSAKLRKRTSKQEDEPQNALLNLLGAPEVTIVPRTGRIPDKLKKRLTKQADEVVNLLLSTLSEPANNPPVVAEQTFKLKKRTTKQNEEIINQVIPLLTTEVVNPPVAKESLDRVKKRLTKFVEEYPNLLVSTLGVQYVTRLTSPLAKLKKRLTKQSDEVINLLTSTLATAPETAPFFGGEQQAKVKKRLTQAMEKQPNLLTSTLGVEYVMRRALFQPEIKKRVTKISDETRNLLTSTLGQAPGNPFIQQEMFQYVKKRLARTDLELRRSLPVSLIPPGIPFTQVELHRVMPRRHKFAAPFDSAGVPLPLLITIPPPPADPPTWVGVSLSDVWRRGGE